MSTGCARSATHAHRLPRVPPGWGCRRWSEGSRRGCPECVVVGRHQRGSPCAGRRCPVWSDGDANSLVHSPATRPGTALGAPWGVSRTVRGAAPRVVSPDGRPWGVGVRPGRRSLRSLGYAGGRSVDGEPAPAVCPSLSRARLPVDVPRRCRVVGVPREQAHVPAEQPPPVQDPRLPAADAHPRGPGDHRRPSAQGSREALRLRCCPRRHACAGVRSSPRSSGPAGVPDGRPWCSTTSPNGP